MIIYCFPSVTYLWSQRLCNPSAGNSTLGSENLSGMVFSINLPFAGWVEGGELLYHRWIVLCNMIGFFCHHIESASLDEDMGGCWIL